MKTASAEYKQEFQLPEGHFLQFDLKFINKYTSSGHRSTSPNETTPLQSPATQSSLPQRAETSNSTTSLQRTGSSTTSSGRCKFVFSLCLALLTNICHIQFTYSSCIKPISRTQCEWYFQSIFCNLYCFEPISSSNNNSSSELSRVGSLSWPRPIRNFLVLVFWKLHGSKQCAPIFCKPFETMGLN